MGVLDPPADVIARIRRWGFEVDKKILETDKEVVYSLRSTNTKLPRLSRLSELGLSLSKWYLIISSQNMEIEWRVVNEEYFSEYLSSLKRRRRNRKQK